jgi:hypothetical protein
MVKGEQGETAMRLVEIMDKRVDPVTSGCIYIHNDIVK